MLMINTYRSCHDRYGGECRKVGRGFWNSDALPLCFQINKKNKTTKQKGQVSETIIPSEIVWCYFEIAGCKASIIILSYIVYNNYIFEFYSDFTSDCVIGEINHMIGKKNIQAIYF